MYVYTCSEDSILSVHLILLRVLSCIGFKRHISCAPITALLRGMYWYGHVESS